MKIQHSERCLKYGIVAKSNDADVQETLDYFYLDAESECRTLNRGDRMLVGAVYMEVSENPDWHPTPYIRQLMQDINGRIRRWLCATHH